MSTETLWSEKDMSGVQRIHGEGTQEVRAEPLELLRTLTKFDTSNPPGDVRACVDFVATLLRERQIEPVLVGLEPERPNVIARVPGAGSSPPLLLYGHLDVVPANADEWTHPPFDAELVDGEVWGRGTLD